MVNPGGWQIQTFLFLHEYSVMLVGKFCCSYRKPHQCEISIGDPAFPYCVLHLNY